MVANRQERGCGRQHRECSRVDRISGRTNGRGKRTKSGSNTSVIPVSYSCRTKVVLAVLDRQRSGVKATIWWFCHDHDRSGRSAMIGNIGKEWSAQCDLGFRAVWPWNLTDDLEKQKAPLLSIIKLYASFHHHMWIQTRVTVRKRLSWVLTSVTLTFDLWPWPLAWTSLLSLVITHENFMMIRWWEHGEKGVTDGRTSSENLISAAMKQAAPHTCFFFLVFFI